LVKFLPPLWPPAKKAAQLGKVLKDLSAYMENAVKLRGKSKVGNVLPHIRGRFLFLRAYGALYFSWCQDLRRCLPSSAAELPLPTRITVAISDTLIHNFPIALLLGGGLVAFVVYTNKTPKGKMFFDKLKLDIRYLAP